MGYGDMNGTYPLVMFKQQTIGIYATIIMNELI